jgi:hypothetical protein
LKNIEAYLAMPPKSMASLRMRIVRYLALNDPQSFQDGEHDGCSHY